MRLRPFRRTVVPMWKPDEVIFAPTGECGLSCPHCAVSRDKGELSIGEALAFLDSCAGVGVERVGFSGGEPFLRPEFVAAISAAAVDRGMLFDRLMTSGDWWRSDEELRGALATVADSGFDGAIGLSWDAYHGQAPERMVSFLEAAFAAFGRRDVVEILSVRSPDDSGLFAAFAKAAQGLGGSLEYGFGEPARMVDQAYRERSEEDPDEGLAMYIPITLSPRSDAGRGASLSGAVGNGEARPDDAWFVDDYCAGLGNVLYVHPDGSVAPCCGFANERPELALGKIADGAGSLVEAARTIPMARAAFDAGLGAVRSALEGQGRRFPGKTRDICAFCERLCATVPASEISQALDSPGASRRG